MPSWLAFGFTFMVTVSAVGAEDNPKARMSIGDVVGAFKVKDITGPSSGEMVCYRCKYGTNPVACIFIREITPEVVSLITALDDLVGASDEKQLKAFVVLLTANADAGAKKLAQVGRENAIKNIPLTVFDQESGPRVYRISDNAAITLLLWHKNKLTANRGFSSAKLSDESRKSYIADIGNMLGG